MSILHPTPRHVALCGEGGHILALHMPVLRDGGTDACPQCQGLALLSLSDSTTNCLLLRNPLPLSRPTACFYWLISLLFPTLALHPTDRRLPPQSCIGTIPALQFSLVLFQCKESCTEATKARLGAFSKEFL